MDKPDAVAGRRKTGGWPAERVAQMLALVAEGHSYLEVSRRMGLTKGAVAGRMSRLDLPKQPSPIKRSADPAHVKRQDRPKCAPKTTLPPVAALVSRRVATPSAQAAPAGLIKSPITTASAPVQSRGSQPRPAMPPAAVRARVSACQWLMGERRAYVTCDAPTLPGKSYCGPHCKSAYTAPGPLPRGIHA